MKEFTAPLKATTVTIVDENNTAAAVGSGSLPVFSTPMMIALMEKATCTACEPILDEGETTVGTNINVAHIKASGINARITASVTLVRAEGRKLTFEVSAADNKNEIIGKGEIERFVVNSQKFMGRVNENEV